MAEPAALTAVVFAPAYAAPEQIKACAVEVARVGAGALRLPEASGEWSLATRRAVEFATGLVVLAPGDEPVELLLRDEPIAELHAALMLRPAGELVVGGPAVSALLAGLAAGTHLRAGSADFLDAPGVAGTLSGAGVRHEVQLVARAAGLARLAGRPPMTADQFRARWRIR
ncbi:MAG TPA: hypothetical protein VK816_03280 [Jatrophihabitantaceae bacterium]|nr:hypothetical protein [Jatrophihabitantaceae bacterium]